MWSPIAKDRTLKAAEAAGLPRNPVLHTEPEAAALATLRDKADDDTLRVASHLLSAMLAVDLISYRIRRIYPLAIDECAIGDGGLCGSIWQDIAFENMMVGIIGEAEMKRMKPINKRRMMKSFETIKRGFDGKDREFMVDLRDVEPNESMGIYDDFMLLKLSHLRTIFDLVCDQIDRLVTQQINDARTGGNVIKAILLVGGFGMNKYLHGYLAKSYHNERIRVIQVDGAWSAIARGACMWGLEQCENGIPPSLRDSDLFDLKNDRGTVASRISKYSYGFLMQHPFDANIHHMDELVTDKYSGITYATNQMTWILKRGESVDTGRRLLQTVFHTVEKYCPRQSFSTAVYYSEKDNPPQRLADGPHQLCEVSYTISDSQVRLSPLYPCKMGLGDVRDLDFDLYLIPGNAMLEFQVKYQNVTMAQTKAKYVEDF
ncbi:hypothetical protein MKZ38_002662 [Zalerion maritima]|uniref:Uncharacterized protein n=1 Tax=Zalerion maritima TaxID=339359 RepID=A0AAD5RNM1_9PEZI|nr:hypothetical protein MKZ38_002662 [Zalerion maritima]